MNRKYWILTYLFFSLISINLQAQVTKPLPPIFDYLTIDLDTGAPTLFWSPPAFNPLREDPTGYIIYKRFYNILYPQGIDEAIDTVGPTVFSYTDFTSNGNIEKLVYQLTSKGSDPIKPSNFSTLHSNIFITSFYDSCNHKIDITWNSYKGWDNATIYPYYYLYVGNTSNWNSFALKDSISMFSNHYSLRNITENQDYYFYLTARRIDKPFKTYSSLYHKFTDMPIHPAYMSIDSVLAENQKVKIFYKIDPATELNNFQVVRWENSDSVKSIFSKKILHQFSDPTTTYYADTIDSWAARTRPFYYKIDAINSCPKIIKVTNHSNTIIPVAHNVGHTVDLSWSELFIDSNRVKMGNYAKYRVIRYANMNGALPPAYLPETDKLETIDTVHMFEGQGYSAQFCYVIEAFERNSTGVNVMLSRSRKQCAEVIPGVIMPDAIVPNDNTFNNGNARNMLTPVITYKVDKYTLSIYNRSGNLIFNGVNTGWNGRMPGGQLAREGTYVYRLVVSTSGNQDVIKTGSIAVVYK